MLVVAQVFAALAAAVHVLIFVMESVLFTRPQVYRRFLVKDAQEAELLRPMALNQGFYNLFLAIGAVVGVVLISTDQGKALVYLACGSMLAAALVLLATNRRMARAAATQGVLPLLAVVFLLLS
jgi:putative membrane protein